MLTAEITIKIEEDGQLCGGGGLVVDLVRLRRTPSPRDVLIREFQRAIDNLDMLIFADSADEPERE